MACATMLPYYEDYIFLMDVRCRLYEPMILTSKNKLAFEIRCFENDICDRVLESISLDLFTDPEDILWDYQLALQYELSCFKKNEKRKALINRMLVVLSTLEIELKAYRGDINYRYG